MSGDPPLLNLKCLICCDPSGNFANGALQEEKMRELGSGWMWLGRQHDQIIIAYEGNFGGVISYIRDVGFIIRLAQFLVACVGIEMKKKTFICTVICVLKSFT